MATTAIWEDGHIEVGYGADDDLDAESCVTDVTSLSSTVFNYQYENGRRYHNFRSGKYLLPNDEKEQDRLDMMHHVWLLMLRGKLFHSPIVNPRNALDIGTGTGIYAIELADTFPDCKVVGIDLSPIQPAWVPPNCEFIVDDFEDAWTFPPNHFDFIHARNLMGSVKDWKALIKTAFKHTAPGGYLEIHDFDLALTSDDGSFKPDNPANIYLTKLQEAARLSGAPMDGTDHLASYLKKAGFTDVTVRKYKCPSSPWAKDKHFKEIGTWTKEISQTGAEAYGMALFTRVLGLEEQEARSICDKYKNNLDDMRIHSYGTWQVIFGRKP